MASTPITARQKHNEDTKMELMKQLEVWFLVGSQHLYGATTLKQVTDHARTITNIRL